MVAILTLNLDASILFPLVHDNVIVTTEVLLIRNAALLTSSLVLHEDLILLQDVQARDRANGTLQLWICLVELCELCFDECEIFFAHLSKRLLILVVIVVLQFNLDAGSTALHVSFDNLALLVEGEVRYVAFLECLSQIGVLLVYQRELLIDRFLLLV